VSFFHFDEGAFELVNRWAKCRFVLTSAFAAITRFSSWTVQTRQSGNHDALDEKPVG
jgi:hypothetical protein